MKQITLDKIKEIRESLGGGDKLSASKEKTSNKVAPNLEILKKTDKTNKGKHGGVRRNSGRRKTVKVLEDLGVKQLLKEHVNEVVEMTVIDRGTGKTIKIKKPRSLAMLETLFQIGQKEKSVIAIKEWLDRCFGKAPQTLRGGDEDDEPIKIDIGIDRILEKVYGNEQDGMETH